jgi:hypothetical protein
MAGHPYTTKFFLLVKYFNFQAKSHLWMKSQFQGSYRDHFFKFKSNGCSYLKMTWTNALIIKNNNKGYVNNRNLFIKVHKYRSEIQKWSKERYMTVKHNDWQQLHGKDKHKGLDNINKQRVPFLRKWGYKHTVFNVFLSIFLSYILFTCLFLSALVDIHEKLKLFIF